MNKLSILAILTLTLMMSTLTSCGSKESAENSGEETAQQLPKERAEPDLQQLKGEFDHYFALKNALVASDAEQSQAIAQHFLEAQVEPSAPKSSWSQIAEASKLKTQRTAFETLSNALYKQAEQKGKGTIYVQFCPMAFDNKGAQWLSREEEIMNPYFGDQMLHCGSVQEVIGE